MTELERIGNIASLGYTDREAEFLCRAALHGGYFVRRQYLTFADCERGRTDTTLTDKALSARHVKELVFRYNRTVYSFCSKPFFAALGNPDSRNRRTHEIPTIKSRLVGFDFVLSHPNLRYLATEAEKVQYFQEAFGVDAESLPFKRYRAKNSSASTERYFVDKFPIAIEQGTHGEERVVFTYVDDGDHCTSGFEAYLQQYQPLFARVSTFHLVYVSVIREHLDAAKRLFANRISGKIGRPPLDPDGVRLLKHFVDRDAFERKDLSRFDQRKLIQFREDRRTFAGQKHDELFERWRAGGEHDLLRAISPECAQAGAAGCEFSTWLSAFRYELFGTITGGNWHGESQVRRTTAGTPPRERGSAENSRDCSA